MRDDDVQCALLTTTAELQAFVTEWVRFCEEDAQSTPFQRPEWLVPWWQQFGADGNLRVVVVRRGGHPQALLPFYRFRDPATGQEQLQMLGVGTTDYLDGVFAKACGPAEVMQGLSLLADGAGEWEVLHASQLRAESLLRASLLSEKAVTYPSESCSRMTATPIEQLPTKLRRNIMYYRNVAQRKGELRLCVAGASELPTVLEEFVLLHTERWKSIGQPGVLADPRVIAWHLQAAPLLEQAGLLRLYRLRLGEETLAIMYAVVDAAGRTDRTCYCYLPAFATEFRDLRPGTLLLAYLQEAMLREGVDTIDMLRGDETYKQHWRVEQVPTAGIAVSRSALREHRLEPRPLAVRALLASRNERCDGGPDRRR